LAWTAAFPKQFGITASDGLYVVDFVAKIVEHKFLDTFLMADPRTSTQEKPFRDGVFLSDLLYRVQEKLARDTPFLSDSTVKLLEKLLREGVYLSDVRRSELARPFLDQVLLGENAFVQAVRQRFAADGVYLADTAVRALERFLREGVFLSDTRKSELARQFLE